MSSHNGDGQSVPFERLDIPIVKLVPRSERKVNKEYRERIAASLTAVGLIDPLVVYPLGKNYEILDGSLRYQILLELGVETLSCLLFDDRPKLPEKPDPTEPQPPAPNEPKEPHDG